MSLTVTVNTIAGCLQIATFWEIIKKIFCVDNEPSRNIDRHVARHCVIYPDDLIINYEICTIDE